MTTIQCCFQLCLFFSMFSCLVLSLSTFILSISAPSFFYLFLSLFHPLTIFLPSITFPSNMFIFSSLSCNLSLPPHCYCVMMQLLLIHQGLKLYMEDSRHFLADSHLTFVFLDLGPSVFSLAPTGPNWMY